VSSRSDSTVNHISHDRLYSDCTHPHCRSPAGPRAVSPARLQLVLCGRSAFLCRRLKLYLFPIVALFLFTPISSSRLTHLCLLLRQYRLNPTSSYPHALQSDKEPRGASTDLRRPGMLQIGSLSCWINQFRKQAGKVTAKNQLTAFTDPAGSAASAAWHGFQWPACIVPPTFKPKIVVHCPLPRLPPHSGSSGQPVLRGISASVLEQTYGRRPGALCPATRAADYPGRRGSLRRRHAVARWGKAARGAEAAEHRPGQVGSTSNTIHPRAVCHVRLPKQQSGGCRDVLARQRVWSRACPGRRRALPSGSSFPGSSAEAVGISASAASPAAASSFVPRGPGSYSEPPKKWRH
jgi:hypothetical protein